MNIWSQFSSSPLPQLINIRQCKNCFNPVCLTDIGKKKVVVAKINVFKPRVRSCKIALGCT